VKAGKSYDIVIDVKDTISGCMSTIHIPKLDDKMYYLEAGNKITFHIKPTETGKFPITCAMGVPHGYITVE
jgi:heme/copper-type cytochrome/quinol oxidase subunit 2